MRGNVQGLDAVVHRLLRYPFKHIVLLLHPNNLIHTEDDSWAQEQDLPEEVMGESSNKDCVKCLDDSPALGRVAPDCELHGVVLDPFD